MEIGMYAGPEVAEGPKIWLGNDILHKVHNPSKRLFGHEKKSAIGQLPKQIPKMSTKT